MELAPLVAQAMAGSTAQMTQQSLSISMVKQVVNSQQQMANMIAQQAAQAKQMYGFSTYA